MSTKLQISNPPVTTGIDVIIRYNDGLVWNTTTELFEVWDDADLALYVISAVYAEGNLFLVQWPLVMESANEYTFIATLRIDVGAPALDDSYIGGGSAGWDVIAQELVIAGGINTSLSIVHDTTQIITEQG